VTPVDLSKLLGSFRVSSFRLETFERYTIPEEQAWLDAFQRDGSLPDLTVDNDPWLRLIADAVGVGKRLRRVHLVRRPLSDYLRFELGLCQFTAAAGEEVRIADLDEHPQLATLHTDFWLFDDQVAVVMRYDAQGRFLGAEPGGDPAPWRRQRDLALACSVELKEFLVSSDSPAQRAGR